MGPSANSLPFTSQSGHSSLFIYCQGAGRVGKGGAAQGLRDECGRFFFFSLSLSLSLFS